MPEWEIRGRNFYSFSICQVHWESKSNSIQLHGWFVQRPLWIHAFVEQVSVSAGSAFVGKGKAIGRFAKDVWKRTSFIWTGSFRQIGRLHSRLSKDHVHSSYMQETQFPQTVLCSQVITRTPYPHTQLRMETLSLDRIALSSSM